LETINPDLDELFEHNFQWIAKTVAVDMVRH
jgi:hypothetical protein